MSKMRTLIRDASEYLERHDAGEDPRKATLALDLMKASEHERELMNLNTAALSATRNGQPVAVLPPEILERIRTGEPVQKGLECEDCGLEHQLPGARACMVCGGVLGWDGWSYKNKMSEVGLEREIVAAGRMGSPEAASRLSGILERRRAVQGPPPSVEDGTRLLTDEWESAKKSMDEAAEQLAALNKGGS